MSLLGDAKGYAIARRTLIYALRSLATLPEGSFVLVGAHAVHLRAPEVIASIAPFTLDGDLAADPVRIRIAHVISDHLERAGFVFRNEYGGFYWRGDASEDEREATKIDILVPQSMEHLWQAEGFQRRDYLATQSQRGLELCLVDHSPMRLGHIGVDDSEESIVVEVASILALLVAKGWKIGERYELGAEAFHEVRKDIADVYLLLRAADFEAMETVLRERCKSNDLKEVARRGARFLKDLCGSGGPGLVLLREILGRGEEADLILASLAALSEDFAGLAESTQRA
jgi:hypothetical protein